MHYAAAAAAGGGGGLVEARTLGKGDSMIDHHIRSPAGGSVLTFPLSSPHIHRKRSC
jgi:hypothetical protein